MPDVLRILVVDDDPDQAFLVGDLLKHQGHSVKTATDGQSAIPTALEFRPHVILLDLLMAGMDGYEVARRLRQEAGMEGVRIIAMSGNAVVGNEVVTKGTDINHYLLKPFRMADFKQALAGSGTDFNWGERPN